MYICIWTCSLMCTLPLKINEMKTLFVTADLPSLNTLFRLHLTLFSNSLYLHALIILLSLVVLDTSVRAELGVPLVSSHLSGRFGWLLWRAVKSCCYWRLTGYPGCSGVMRTMLDLWHTGACWEPNRPGRCQSNHRILQMLWWIDDKQCCCVGMYARVW